ncbi:MAG: MMPL family transporter, partial [Planctomycetota bacterium]
MSPSHHSEPRSPRRDRGVRAVLDRRVADLVVGRPMAIVLVSAVLAIAGAAIAWRSLELDADTNSLIGADRPFMRLYRSFLEEFGDLENLYVVVDARPDGGPLEAEDQDEADARAAVDRLLERLRTIPGLPGIRGRIESREQLALSTRAMEIRELEGLVEAERTLPLIAEGDTTGAIARARQDLATLLARGVLLDDAARRRLAAGSIAALETALAAGEAGAESLANAPPARYLTSETGRLHFIAILPEKDFNRLDAIRAPLAAIREVVGEVRTEFPTVEIGLTGKPVLQADELATTDRDMVRAASIAGVAIAAMFMVVFRSVVRPMLAVASFAMAFGWTYGLATLLVGHLNLLSIVFMLVLVGVGVDYGVHVVARYVEARQRRLSAGAVRVVMRTAMPGNVTGAMTSSAVFLLALVTEFQGLRELGLIAGGGLLLCMVAMTLDLPALLHLTERRGRRRDPR